MMNLKGIYYQVSNYDEFRIFAKSNGIEYEIWERKDNPSDFNEIELKINVFNLTREEIQKLEEYFDDEFSNLDYQYIIVWF